MASSGTIGKLTGSYSTTYTITWSLLSQSTANNTSKIRLTATFKTGNTTTISSDYSTFRMDRTTVYSGSYSKTGSGNIFTRTKDITVSHNNDGTFPGRTVSYSTNDYIMGSQSGSGSISGVPSIPRQAVITNAPNFNDEENPTITYSNKAGSIVTSLQACISLDGTTDDIEYRDIPIDGSSYTFNLTEAERNVLRNATTTSNTRNVVFMIKTILGGNTFYSQANATLSIVNANPIFTASNISYLDTNASVVAITQNNQDIVRNQSTLQISYTGAAGVKGATISSYEITFNTDIRTKSTPSTIYYGTINLSQNSPLTIKAIDSRGNSTIATKMITILDWINPSAIISLGRVNNFEDSTKLKVEVTISSVNEKNAIQRIRYRYKKTSEETYSGYTIINNNVEYTLTLAKEYSWNVQIEINDKFGTTIYNTTVAKGVPILFIDPNKRALGINCFPEEDESLYLNGVKVTPGGGGGTGDYPQLTNKPQINSVELLGNKTSSDLGLQSEITNNNKLAYSLISGTPTIPTALSELSQDTTHRVVTDTEKTTWNSKANISDIPTKTSELTNDSGFIDNTYHDNTKQDTLVSGTNIKTINNVSLLGSGNIDIQGGGGSGTGSNDAITLEKTSSQSISGSDYNKITFNTSTTCGTKLTFSNNGILVGAGISKILVGASMYISGSAHSGDRINLDIEKNGVQVTTSQIYFGGAQSSISISPILLDVVEGDLITLHVRNRTSSTGTIYSTGTYLTALNVPPLISEETVLYHNDTGSSTSVTLSENATKFHDLTICFRNDNNGEFGSINVHEPATGSSKRLSISCLRLSSSGLAGATARATINGTTITLDGNRGIDGAFSTIGSTYKVYITSVIGRNRK